MKYSVTLLTIVLEVNSDTKLCEQTTKHCVSFGIKRKIIFPEEIVLYAKNYILYSSTTL